LILPHRNTRDHSRSANRTRIYKLYTYKKINNKIIHCVRYSEGKVMAKEVMNLIDDCTGEMQCRVCGSIHIAKRDDEGKYPPESLWCIHGCKSEDVD
jgi:hypothetical protein